MATTAENSIDRWFQTQIPSYLIFNLHRFDLRVLDVVYVTRDGGRAQNSVTRNSKMKWANNNNRNEIFLVDNDETHEANAPNQSRDLIESRAQSMQSITTQWLLYMKYNNACKQCRRIDFTFILFNFSCYTCFNRTDAQTQVNVSAEKRRLLFSHTRYLILFCRLRIVVIDGAFISLQVLLECSI